jgi:hypothetical protein
MAKAVVDRILQEIKSLELTEQQLLRDQLDAIIEPAEDAGRRAAVRRALRDAGLVTHTRLPRTADIPDRQLIHAQGKPVSETIIEDRR